MLRACFPSDLACRRDVPGFDEGDFKQFDAVEEVVGEDLVSTEFALEPVDFVEEGLFFEGPLFFLDG